VRLVTFELKAASKRGERLGALVDESVVDLNAADSALPADMLALLDGGDAALAAARKALASKAAKSASRPLSEVRLRAPLPRPRALRDFFAFEDHAKAGAARRGEPMQPAWYEQPVYYKGNPREVYGPDDVAPWPAFTRKLDFEHEIACVIGKKGRDVEIGDARGYIAGYMIFNDWSARDIQKNEMLCRMGPAKAKDFANGFGPYLLTSDELPEPSGLKMRAAVNGETWSEGDSSGRYWSFETMLSHVSQCETILPGDILGSGTYHKGCGLDMDRWLAPGDVLELSVDKLGTLRQTVGTPSAQKQLKYTKAEAAWR
jgi:2-keto-4-pentenoate hydratase/2-oxohepta-3-ene-1,7-dioic acid hydratase in catechol pathway